MLNQTQGYRAFAFYSYIKFKLTKINNLYTTNEGFSYNLLLNDLKKTIIAFNIKDRMIFGKEIDDIPLDKGVYEEVWRLFVVMRIEWQQMRLSVVIL